MRLNLLFPRQCDRGYLSMMTDFHTGACEELKMTLGMWTELGRWGQL